LFPQHCQLPDMTPYQHLQELTNGLNKTAIGVPVTPKQRRLLQQLEQGIKKLLAPPPNLDEQRVQEERTQAVREDKQRVINDTPIVTIPQITDVPKIMQSRNPTAKRALKKTARLHRQVTRNNTPGIVPVPTLIEPVLLFFPKVRFIEDNPPQRSKRNAIPAKPPQTFTATPRGAWQRLVTQQAINVLTIQEEVSLDTMYTPQALMNKRAQVLPTMFEHFASPMVHPITGETISSYKKLMNDPETAEIWQTAFRKDFGGMAQGDNKMGQEGTNAMFVMTHDKIKQAVAAGKFFTYMNPVVNYRPQKEDPYQIRITAGGELDQL
jgi:hypothetical protein